MGKVNVEKTKEAIKTDLQAIVDLFNNCFAGWFKRYGCTANFRWNYQEEGDTYHKYLAVTSINMPIMSEEPSEEAKKAEEILSQAEPFPIQKA